MPITTTPSGGPQGEFSTYTPIYATTLSSNTASVTFSNIPTTFTDLVLVANGSTVTGSNINLRVGSGSIDTSTNYSYSYFDGNGTTAITGRYSSQTQIQPSNDNAYWNSTVAGAMVIHFQNYSNITTNKTILSRANHASLGVAVNAGVWRSTSAINQIFIGGSSQNLVSGSTFTLYGIKAAAPAPKATGGDTITTDGTYWYHTFNNSGVLDVKVAMSVDYLVVAGGGGANLGGGGAGGLRSTVTATGGSGGLESQLSVIPTQYAVTIGAGGLGTTDLGSGPATNGSNSTFSTITSTGGGAGQSEADGSAGGSGGGGGTGAPAATRVGGAASPSGQGFAGGGTGGGRNRASGGGGGAGGTGNTNSAEQTGAGGGAGRTIFNLAIGGGGGGGGRSAYANGSGINFGGGSGGTYTGGAENATNGTANTGGGGGGGW